MHIEMKGINKAFTSNQVLKNAGFFLKDGEVHALMGENGAGKSTLMKILTGVYQYDSGTILVDGKEVRYKNPQEAEKAGIVFIYQELNVLFDLTVEENLFMGKEVANKFGVCDRKAMRKKAQEIMDKMGVHIPVGAVMSELSVGQQQMVEICKALMVDAKVLIMDEPTAALTQSETEVLFEVMKSLKAKGVSIVYISHRMEEIFALCDRITILRDGEYIDTRYIKDITMDDVVQMMIGRTIGERFPQRHLTIGGEVLRVENLSHKSLFHNVNFTVHAGEVLGVSGLMGAGRTEIMQAIFGNLPVVEGKIFIDGAEVKIHNTRDAIHAGIGFITEDRKTEGLLLDKSIAQNIELANLDRVSNRGVISNAKRNTLVLQRRSGMRQPQRRQPAKGRYRKMGVQAAQNPHSRRAHPRCGYRCKERDLQHHKPACGAGCGHYSGLLRAALGAGYERPHHGRMRGTCHRHRERGRS